MILKKGVTAFTAGDLSFNRDSKGLKVESHTIMLFSIIQQLNGEVLAWYEPDIMIQYAHAHVKIDEKEFYIFYNTMYDYIAFTNNRLITGLEFIDCAALAPLFKARYKVLTVAQLEEPLLRKKKSDGHILLNENTLNDVELYYMDYYPAQTVGDLVFNYWD